MACLFLSSFFTCFTNRLASFFVDFSIAFLTFFDGSVDSLSFSSTEVANR